MLWEGLWQFLRTRAEREDTVPGHILASNVTGSSHQIKLQKQREGESEIVTEHLSESKDFDEFLHLLPEDDCRYALYKVHYTTRDGRPAEKIVRISWAPKAAHVRNKMIYASSIAALSSVLGGAVTVKFSCGHIEELTPEALEQACLKF